MLRAVDDVDLSLQRGRILALVGASGAGKTMLTRAVLGLAPAGTVVSGAAVFDDVNLMELTPGELRCRLGREPP